MEAKRFAFCHAVCEIMLVDCLHAMVLRDGCKLMRTVYSVKCIEVSRFGDSHDLGSRPSAWNRRVGSSHMHMRLICT